jgi:glycine dehydrogenase
MCVCVCVCVLQSCPHSHSPSHRRYCDALIEIRHEITEIIEGRYGRDNNVLKNAPHTLIRTLDDGWDLPYPRSKAAFPLPHLGGTKMWPHSGRVDDVYGDKNLVTKLQR